VKDRTRQGRSGISGGPGDDPVGDAPEALDLIDDLVTDAQPRMPGGVASPALGSASARLNSTLTCPHASTLHRVCSIKRRTRLMRRRGCSTGRSVAERLGVEHLRDMVDRVGAVRQLLHHVDVALDGGGSAEE
jgi:hypothetical protein